MSDRLPQQTTFAALFTPKLVTVLSEGYGWRQARADAVAGLTVAVVAIPLSMAIAIACGLGPERGLYTAIVGGFLVSALGGSRFQIGGPAGAFIVLVFSIVERHGYDGLALATMMAGGLMVVVGLLRWGVYISYISYPVTVGFTAGIALIIFASQLKELLGLDMAHEPAALIPKLAAMWEALGTIRIGAVAVSLLGVAVILGLRRLRPTWPGLLIAVAVCAVLTSLLHLDLATIGSRFGGVPRNLPAPALPRFDLATLRALVPDALAIALLGSIESLLSAVVADGMSGRRHRSNGELVAQGLANIAAALFGGMPVTGTIARTATNVRAGATGPVSGMLHAVYILLFMMVAAPLASYVPLAALGAVLAVVAWNMAEKAAFWSLLRTSRGDAAVLLATFLLTALVDLTTGIAVGVALGAVLFLHRMSGAIDVRHAGAPPEADVVVCTLGGALFFGATAAVNNVLDAIRPTPRRLVLDLSAVTLIDSTAAHALKSFIGMVRDAGGSVAIAGARGDVHGGLVAAGMGEPDIIFAPDVAEAGAQLRGVSG